MWQGGARHAPMVSRLWSNVPVHVAWLLGPSGPSGPLLWSILVLYFALLWPDQSDSWSVAGSCTARPLSARKVRESFKAPARLAQPQAALSLQLHKFTQQQRSSVPLCI